MVSVFAFIALPFTIPHSIIRLAMPATRAAPTEVPLFFVYNNLFPNLLLVENAPCTFTDGAVMSGFIRPFLV